MQTPTTMAMAIPDSTLIHSGPPVREPVTNPTPVSQAAHSNTPTALSNVNFEGLTPATPAAPAPKVRPNGMKRPATIATPLTARNRRCT